MSYQPMNYGYPYPDRLAQLQNQYQQAVNVPQMPQMQQPPQTNQGLLWVSGEVGAKSYLVAPNSTVLLMDSDSSRFYLKSADNSGMPSLRIFEYKEVTNMAQNAPQGSHSVLNQSSDNFITRNEFDDLKAKYEELERQVKSSNKPAVRKKEVTENE